MTILSNGSPKSLVHFANLVWHQNRYQLRCWLPGILAPLVIVNTLLFVARLQNSASKLAPSDTDDMVESTLARREGFCDLTRGKWIPDESPPLYTNETCRYIQPQQNCMKNGKPTQFLNWRWKPNECQLPRFDPTVFLHLVRSKKLLFFGDSLARNQLQSLLCSLLQVEDPEMVYSKKDDATWFFPTYNFTLAVLWSPFLVKHVKLSEQPLLFNLHLDVPHPVWSSALAQFDYSIFSASQWFYRPSIYIRNSTITGCNRFSGLNYTQVPLTSAYQAALKTTLDFIAGAEGYRGTTYLATVTADHFENGSWDSGGRCMRSSPYSVNHQSMEDLPWLPQSLNKVQMDLFKGYVSGGERLPNGSKLKVLDVTFSTFLRPDAHPGPYRAFQPFSSSPDGVNRTDVINDCLHWCLPGPVEMWNQLLLESIKSDIPQ